MRVDTAARNYLAARRIDAAPLTRRKHSYILDQFTDFLGREMALKVVKRKHVEEWIADRMKRIVPNTVQAELSIVRTFFAWCVDHEMIRHNPCAGIKGPRVPKGLPREMPEHIPALLEQSPDKRMTAILSLMANESLRRSEVGKLTLEEIDLHHRVALVHGKGSKDRWVALTKETVDAIHAYLMEWPAASGPLIRSYQHPNRALGLEQISRLVRELMFATGIKERAFDGRSAHALRHTGVGAMLDAGADLRDVMDQTGHENLQSLQPYTKRRASVDRIREHLPKYG